MKINFIKISYFKMILLFHISADSLLLYTLTYSNSNTLSSSIFDSSMSKFLQIDNIALKKIKQDPTML